MLNKSDDSVFRCFIISVDGLLISVIIPDYGIYDSADHKKRKKIFLQFVVCITIFKNHYTCVDNGDISPCYKFPE